MTYQPYPTGPESNQIVQPEAPSEQPRTIVNAVRFMYVGAALQTLGIILSLATIGSLRSQIHKKFPTYTSAQIHSAEVVGVVAVVVVGIIGIALWLWMARANGTGHRYGRIVATVLFALYTLDILLSFARAQAFTGLIFGLLTWLVGLGATWFLWRKESTAYFGAASPR
ncbi:MAG TPA: hypothetical protein VGI58_19055 [Streptosporangiaceae bacterium]|jgi:hypothetical protein